VAGGRGRGESPRPDTMPHGSECLLP
jgi:hypothetical protein